MKLEKIDGLYPRKKYLDKIRGFGSSTLNGIKSFFGIASPSKLFEEQIGKNLALGVGEGFSGSMKDISKQMQKITQSTWI